MFLTFSKEFEVFEAHCLIKNFLIKDVHIVKFRLEI